MADGMFPESRCGCEFLRMGLAESLGGAKLVFMRKSPRAQRGSARTKLPERTPVEMQLLSLDQWLDADHRVRIVWQYVDLLDLSELYASIKATEGNVGRGTPSIRGFSLPCGCSRRWKA